MRRTREKSFRRLPAMSSCGMFPSSTHPAQRSLCSRIFPWTCVPGHLLHCAASLGLARVRSSRYTVTNFFHSLGVSLRLATLCCERMLLESLCPFSSCARGQISGDILIACAVDRALLRSLCWPGTFFFADLRLQYTSFR